MIASPSNDTVIETVRLSHEMNGPHYLVLGGVHGTEPCGPLAIKQVLDWFGEGRIRLTRGQITFVPVCNPRALAQEVRYVDRNLNRLLFPKASPETYEDVLGNQLCPLLAQADYVLDLHSSQTTDRDFIFLGRPGDEIELAFARAVGSHSYFYGFAESYARVGKGVDPQTGMGTTEYARSQKAKAAITLECGQHEDPLGVDVGFHGILRAGLHLGMFELDAGLTQMLQNHPGAHYPEQVVRIDLPVFKQAEGRFTKEWRHMMEVQQGEVLAEYVTGARDIAPYDGLIIMPREIDAVGADWFMLGKRSSFAEFMLGR